jgi:hypothetical protein
MFQLAFTCATDQMNRSFPDKNLSSGYIRIKFCLKTGKSDSETLAVLTLGYGEYARKKLSVFEWHMRYKQWQKMCFQLKTTLVCFFDHRR